MSEPTNTTDSITADLMGLLSTAETTNGVTAKSEVKSEPKSEAAPITNAEQLKVLEPKKRGGRKAIYTAEERKQRHKDSMLRSRSKNPEKYGRKTYRLPEVELMIQAALKEKGVNLSNTVISNINAKIMELIEHSKAIEDDPKKVHTFHQMQDKIALLRDLTKE